MSRAIIEEDASPRIGHGDEINVSVGVDVSCRKVTSSVERCPIERSDVCIIETSQLAMSAEVSQAVACHHNEFHQVIRCRVSFCKDQIGNAVTGEIRHSVGFLPVRDVDTLRVTGQSDSKCTSEDAGIGWVIQMDVDLTFDASLRHKIRQAVAIEIGDQRGAVAVKAGLDGLIIANSEGSVTICKRDIVTTAFLIRSSSNYVIYSVLIKVS